MNTSLKIALAQCNLTVGDIQKNLNIHITAAKKARDELKADLIVFPELSLTGYPPEDLLFRQHFIDLINQALITLKNSVTEIYCLVGHPLKTSDGLFNACSLIYNGEIIAQYAKRHLPNYEVFDEYRYFTPGKKPCVVNIKNIPVGIIICEDLWQMEPIIQSVEQGAQCIIVPNASPFEIDKHKRRIRIIKEQTAQTNVPILYCNCVGGQDDFVFDGGSMAVDSTGEIRQFAGFFNENILCVDLTVSKNNIQIAHEPFFIPEEIECIYQALVTGTRDYIEKNHFPGVIIGVSGGIDSALTLAVAVDALGAERVHAVFMPSRFSSQLSMEEAISIAENLNVSYEMISIEEPFNSFLNVLKPRLEEQEPGILEQNIQSRCRGVILMAISNQTKSLVLTTGNRSELAVGYATLYGDMAGGFAVLKDISKTMVYHLAHYRNQLNHVIPARTISREPTAELCENQKDTDTLPPYNILDKIIAHYIDEELSVEDIIAKGFNRTTVQNVIRSIQLNEYKRRQYAVGVRIHARAFGKDRRYPITSGYKET